MSRNSSGVYTLPTGNPVVTNTLITTAWANPTMADLASELTNSLDRNGRGGMLAPFKLIDGSAAAPAFSFQTEPSTGFYRYALNDFRVSVGGSDVVKFTPTGLSVNQGLGVAGNFSVTGQLNGPLNFGGFKGTGAADPTAAQDLATKAYVDQRTPVGGMIDFAGVAAPAGWLLCDGSAVSRTTYAALFAVIGTTWGVGDNSTTFNLPDLRRRVTIGSGGAAISGPGNTVGSVGGEETHVLSQAEMPSHSHPINISDPGHAHGVYDPGHSHTTNIAVLRNLSSATGYTILVQPGTIDPNNPCATTASSTGIGIYGNSTGVTASSTAVGGGGSHNNMQPSAVVTKIIKY